MALNRVVLTHILAIVAVISIPRIPFLVDYALVAVSAVLAVITILALWWQQRIFEFFLGTALLMVFILGKVFTPAGAGELLMVFRVSGIAGFLLLHVLLLVGPWSRHAQAFLTLYTNRRPIGVALVLMLLLHSSSALVLAVQNTGYGLFHISAVCIGFFSFFLLFWTALVSWQRIQEVISMRWWNIIHGALFLLYAGFVVYFFKIAEDSSKISTLRIQPWEIALMVFIVVFWIVVAPWSLPRLRVKTQSLAKHISLLAGIAYVAIVAHVWTGSIAGESRLVQGLLLAPVLFLISSRVAGWFALSREYISQKRNPELLECEGVRYYRIGNSTFFEEGIGKERSVRGISVAVFRNNGAVHAFRNECPHRGGAVAHARLIDGFLVCPWHGLQFDIMTGVGSNGMVLEKFAAVEYNGAVFVAVD